MRPSALRVRPRSPEEAIAAGLAYLPEDRRRHGVVLDLPVSSNLTLASLAQTGQILVDSSIREAIGPEWEIERREGLSGLDDDVEAWSIRLPPASQA